MNIIISDPPPDAAPKDPAQQQADHNSCIAIGRMVTDIAKGAEKKYPRLQRTDFEIAMSDDGEIGTTVKGYHFPNPEHYKITFDAGFFQSLPPALQKVVVAHEMAHIALGHFDKDKQGRSVASLIGLGNNEEAEREAIRTALELYPHPKAFIEVEACIYSLVKESASLHQEAYDKAVKNWEIKKALEAQSKLATSQTILRRGNREHPHFRSCIAEIVRTAADMAKEGKCEQVDEDFLRTMLPPALRTNINPAHVTPTSRHM